MGCQVSKGEIQNCIDFFAKKNVNLGKNFLMTSISKALYFQKRSPIFDGSPLYLRVTSLEQLSVAEFGE